MTKASKEFEQQIARVHSLIEQDGSEVTWNDRIPDPDNPGQMRQIDVSVRRDGALTLIECRFHRDAQDVQWIEELIGRRTSLVADAVIAVSASGFTSGAIRKAKAHGIILRDVVSLTEQEIQSWGHRTTTTITFFKFEDITLVFEFDRRFEENVTPIDVERAMSDGSLALASMFDKLVEGAKAGNRDLEPMRVQARVIPTDVVIGRAPVKAIRVDLALSKVTRNFRVPSVVAYDVPEAGALERNAFVEQVELGRFEITQSSNIVSVAMDLSSIVIPNECKFGSVNFAFSRPVEMREVTFLGLPELGIQIGPFGVGIEFS